MRRDIGSQWSTVNPILAAGEIAVETDTNRFKVGDGVTSYVGLPYFASQAVVLSDHEGASDPHSQYVQEIDLESIGINELPYFDVDQVFLQSFYDQSATTLALPGDFRILVDDVVATGGRISGEFMAGWVTSDGTKGVDIGKTIFRTEYLNQLGGATPTTPNKIALEWTVNIPENSILSFKTLVENPSTSGTHEFRFYIDGEEQVGISKSGVNETHFTADGPLSIQAGEYVFLWELDDPFTAATPALNTARFSLASIVVTPEVAPSQNSVFYRRRSGELYVYNGSIYRAVNGARVRRLELPPGGASAAGLNTGIAIGESAVVTHEGATAIGPTATSSGVDTMTLGSGEKVVLKGATDALELSEDGSGIVMYSPDGTAYRVTVANGGTLNVTAV